MKRTAKKIIVAAAIAAISFQSAAEVSACGGRGGRASYAPVYGGYARAASNYRTTLPATPPIRYGQPAYANPGYPQSSLHGSRAVPVARPASAAPTVAAVQPRPRAQVAMQTASTTQATAPSRVALNQQAVNARPVVQNTATPQTATQSATTNNAVAAPANSDAESSALAALASLASASTAATPQPTPTGASAQLPQFTSAPAANATGSAHVGVFAAQLPSNTTIELRLNNGNTFSWTVKKNGNTTRFDGQYRVTDGRLTLVRSKDLQQMAGSFTAASNGFTFKLDGANNAGLSFKRV